MTNAELKIQEALLGYVAQENLQERLGDGSHTVHLVKWQITNSRLNRDGTGKANLPEFEDAMPQLYVHLQNDHGVAYHRFNTQGFRRWGELTLEQQESGKYERVVFHGEVYACIRNKSGKLVRIVDKQKTADAMSFIDQFMSAVGATGKKLGETLPKLVEKKTPFNIDIEVEDYDGKPQHNVVNFYKASATVTVGDDDEFGS